MVVVVRGSDGSFKRGWYVSGGGMFLVKTREVTGNLRYGSKKEILYAVPVRVPCKDVVDEGTSVYGILIPDLVLEPYVEDVLCPSTTPSGLYWLRLS